MSLGCQLLLNESLRPLSPLLGLLLCTRSFSSSQRSVILGSCTILSMNFIRRNKIIPKRFIIIMPVQSVKSITEYAQLIEYLEFKGIYQVRLLVCLVIYWFFSGLNEALFELAIARNFKDSQFIAQESAQIVSILLTAYFSLYVSRYLTNIVIVGLMVLGSVLLVVGIETESDETKLAGTFTIITFHYCLAFNILMIVLEYFTVKMFAFIWIMGMVSFTVGKMVSVAVYSSDLNPQQTSFAIVVPCSIVYTISLIFSSQSPRFLIDHDVQAAEKLLKQICEVNRIRNESITFMLQRQFFWNKISLKKYSFATLYKYPSISYNTYMLAICALLLGIICRCPDFIQHLQSGTNFEVEDSVEIIWVSTFQLCGLFPAYITTSVIQRRTLTIVLSVVLMIISFLLAGLQRSNVQMGDGILYSMAIFGLSSFFSVSLFFFLLLSALEFYPHTIRTLACGVILALYKLGKLLFSLHIEFMKDNELMMELVTTCSVLLLIHCCLLSETKNQLGKYQILEIEEKDIEEY